MQASWIIKSLCRKASYLFGNRAPSTAQLLIHLPATLQEEWPQDEDEQGCVGPAHWPAARAFTAPEAESTRAQGNTNASLSQ